MAVHVPTAKVVFVALQDSSTLAMECLTLSEDQYGDSADSGSRKLQESTGGFDHFTATE